MDMVSPLAEGASLPNPPVTVRRKEPRRRKKRGEVARASPCRDSHVCLPSVASVAAWVALVAYAHSREPLPNAGLATAAAVFALMAWDAMGACCARESARPALLATPAVLMTLHWSTSTAMRRCAPALDNPQKAGIADAAVPFVIATLAGGAMLLLQPSLGGECASATRRGTLHIAVGSFLTHMATSLSAKR